MEDLHVDRRQWTGAGGCAQFGGDRSFRRAASEARTRVGEAGDQAETGIEGVKSSKDGNASVRGVLAATAGAAGRGRGCRRCEDVRGCTGERPRLRSHLRAVPASPSCAPWVLSWPCKLLCEPLSPADAIRARLHRRVERSQPETSPRVRGTWPWAKRRSQRLSLGAPQAADDAAEHARLGCSPRQPR